MPIIDIDELTATPTLGMRPQAVVEPDVQTPTQEVFKAAFRQDNTIGSMLANEVPIDMQPNESYDPFSDIVGYELHAESFINAGNLEDVSKIKSQIDREKSDRQLVQDSGWMGITASLAAGIVDPINLIPVGGSAAKAYTIGGSILKGAAATARAGLIGATVAETALHSTQETRTLGESAANVAGATLLSGVLGGAVGAFGGKRVMELGSQLEKELVVPHPDAPDVMEPNGITLGNDSVGAMRVKKTTLAEETLANAWGVDKAFARLNPKLRLATSLSVESRRYVQDLIETPFRYEKNDAGIANPTALETIVGLQDVRIANAVSGQKSLFKAYKQRPRSEGESNLSFLQFREETAKALRRNDTHTVPEVQKLAQLYRKEILNPMRDAAIGVKLLPEDVKVSTADSYLHRWWNKEKIVAKREQLQAIIHDGLRGEYTKVRGAIENKSATIKGAAEMQTLRIGEEIQQKQRILDVENERNAQFSLNKFKEVKKQFREVAQKDLSSKEFEQYIKDNNLEDIVTALEGIKSFRRSADPEVQNIINQNINEMEKLGINPDTFLDSLVKDLIKERKAARKGIREARIGEKVSKQAERAAKREVSPLLKDIKKLSKFKTKKIEQEIRLLNKKISDVNLKLTKSLADEARDLSDDELGVIAEDIIDNLLGHAETRVPYDLPITTRGPLKERTLNFIRDIDVEDFLINDVEAIAKKYVRTMAPDIAIKERFGDLNIIGKDGLITQKINEDYRNLAAQAKTDKERAFIEGRRKADIADIDAVVNQLRGTYGMPDNPDSLIVRGARVVKQVNFVSKLGGMTASAFADIGRPVMVHGIMRTVGDGVVPLITNLKGYKLAAKEARESAVGLDMVLNGRAMSMAELNDPYVKGTKFEKGLDSLASTFGKVSLMAPWNTAMKQFASVITQGRITKGVFQVIDGTISKQDARYLAKLGIDSDMAKKIANELEKHGDDVDGVMVANAGNWTNAEAQRAFRGALRKEGNNIIVEPGAGDVPLIFKSTEAGKIIGQFRSFSLAATNKILIAGLQERDAAFLNGVILSTSLGMLSYAFKTWDRGEELSSDPMQWIFEGVDRSGVLASLGEINQISNKVTRGKFSLQSMVGAPPLTRYASTNVMGALLGPTVGTVQDTAQIIGSATNADWTKSDSRALRRMIPYQNLMIMRQLFDEMENNINESLGVSK